MANQDNKNPLALNLYVLSYDGNKNLTASNQATKENLQTYLGQYRMVTDAINIKNAYVINIGVKFSIMTLPQYNKNEVLVRCINEIKTFFNIDRWQINQPIIISDLLYKISVVEGVAVVVTPEDAIASGANPTDKPQIIITNKYRTADGYSGNVYDMDKAYYNGIYHTSLDPSMFELKYPDSDIQGRVVGTIGG